jgi:lipoprotein-releasing system ATP-binding protein
MSNEDVLVCRNLYKSYRQGPKELAVLTGINFSVSRGERVAIIGASGSGKSTLLNMLGGLDSPDQGEVLLAGVDMAKLSERQQGALRNKSLGFVYQFHHLLPEFTALENICMPLLIRGDKVEQASNRGLELLSQVGLEQRADHKPPELSGGERQRVAIARALATYPDCVLLDEPTGNLDRQTAGSIHAMMRELNKTLSTSFVVVTHDHQLAGEMDRIYELIDGCLNRIDNRG